MTPDAYQEHVDRLAREMGCRLEQRPRIDGMMFVELGFVVGPVIENQRDYLAVLHELGHFALGHTQGRPPYNDQRFYFDNGVLRSEAEAWRWAIQNCLEPIEDESRRFMWDYCLGSYYANAVEMKDRPTRIPNGDRAHVEFVYDKPDALFEAVVKEIRGDLTDFKIPFP